MLLDIWEIGKEKYNRQEKNENKIEQEKMGMRPRVVVDKCVVKVIMTTWLACNK